VLLTFNFIHNSIEIAKMERKGNRGKERERERERERE
jgi:hypothetical protein